MNKVRFYVTRNIYGDWFNKYEIHEKFPRDDGDIIMSNKHVLRGGFCEHLCGDATNDFYRMHKVFRIDGILIDGTVIDRY